MTRISKKRGKHKTLRIFKNISGISHPLVCLLTAIDDNDNMLFKIAGLGVERREILDQFKGFIEPKSTVVIDKKSDLETFVKDCGCKPDIVDLKNKSIYKKEMPIDLYTAYGEYRYGIFANGIN